MKNIHYFTASIFLLSLMLFGCSPNIEIKKSAQARDSTTQTKEQEPLKPPDLKIQIDEETIRPILGSYSWSRKNPDGTGQAIHADSIPPFEMVKRHKPLVVNKGAAVTFSFENNPQKYEIREWVGEHQTKTYKELDLSNHEGITVFDILAYWEEGTATYAFVLDIN